MENKNIVKVKLGEKFQVKGNRTVVVRMSDKKNNNVSLCDIDITSDEYKNMTPEQQDKVIYAKQMKLFEVKGESNNFTFIDSINTTESNDEKDFYSDVYKKLSLGEKHDVVNNDSINSTESNDKIDIYSDVYKKLSDEEKLDVVKKELDDLFVTRGKKNIVVYYNGEKKEIDREKLGKYKDLVEREKSLVKKLEIKSKQSNVSDTTALAVIDNNKKTKKGSNLITKIKKKTAAFYNLCKEKITKKNNTKKTKKNKKRRIAAVICAIAVFFGITLSKCNKGNRSNNIPTKETTSQTGALTNDNKEPINNEDNNLENNDDKVNGDNINNGNNTELENDNNNNNNDIESGITNDTLSFDDTVTISNNSYIYKNSYDATYNTNPYNPYYSNSYERDVEGLVYELDGKIYIIYKNDTDALQKQKELEGYGATITAVLVNRSDITNTGEYEGYYNVNNVKVKTR